LVLIYFLLSLHIYSTYRALVKAARRPTGCNVAETFLETEFEIGSMTQRVLIREMSQRMA